MDLQMFQSKPDGRLNNLIADSIRGLVRRNGEDVTQLLKASVCKDIRTFIEESGKKVFADEAVTGTAALDCHAQKMF